MLLDEIRKKIEAKIIKQKKDQLEEGKRSINVDVIADIISKYGDINDSLALDLANKIIKSKSPERLIKDNIDKNANKIWLAVKDELREEVVVELTEEEKAGKTEAEIAELLEAKKKKMKEEEDEESCDDDEKGGDDEEDDDDEEVDVEESLKTIFASTSLDESLKKDLITLFKVALDEKSIKKCSEMSEKYETEFEEAITLMEDNIDKYISFVATQWLQENELQVESGIKLEIAENFLAGMRDLFVENYVEVPEAKVDLIEEAEETIAELSAKIDESINMNLALTEEINSMKKEKVISEIAVGLTDTEKDKLTSLLESVEYKDDDNYKGQVTLVMEKYFKAGEKKEDEKLDENTDPRMSNYLKFYKKK